MAIRNVTTQYGAIFTIFTVVWMFGSLTGCSEDSSCTTNTDCSAGKICVDGDCVASSGDSETATRQTSDSTVGMSTDSTVDTGTNTLGDTLGTSDTGTDATQDTQTYIDTDVPLDTGFTSDTEEEICEASGQYGSPCTRDCECFGNYCEKNICCVSGECCSVIEDCGNDLCVAPTCDGNATCQYRVGQFQCGVQDEEGTATCSGDRACDGAGNCVTLNMGNCGFYSIASFACSETEAAAVCHTGCTLEDVNVTCIPGALCQEGECVSGANLAEGAACTADSECASAHCENGFCCTEGAC